MKSSIFKNYSATAELMTRESFIGFTEETPERMKIYQEIAECVDDDQRQELKKRLPAVTWQAYFPNGGRRKNVDAVPSGLYIIDIDHIEEPDAIARKALLLKEACNIVVVHKTPSCKGLRVVAKCRQGVKDIPENQEWLARILIDFCPELAGKIDTCVKDLARLSYLVPQSYFYFIDEEIFENGIDEFDDVNEVESFEADEVESFEADEVESFEAAPTPPTDCGNSASSASTLQSSEISLSRPENIAVSEQSESQTHFDGIPLTDIANKWLEMNGGLPEPGGRNSKLYHLAIRLRYITDFNPKVIASCIPHCGLPDWEVQNLCHSACENQRAEEMPNDMKVVLKVLKNDGDNAEEATEEEYDNSYISRMPPLPVGLRESLIGMPDKAKMPILCGVMPLAMAYATGVSVRYADGDIHRLNLMSIIYGKQSSGKSSVKRVVDIWKKPMFDEDDIYHKVEDKYCEMRKSRRATEKLPDEPRNPIRLVPITISCSKLLKRLKNANGKHLFSFGEELDTLIKTNKSGSWSQKYDIYRLAFDNGEWGQDYNSETAESGIEKVCYNFTIMGTPGSVRRAFRDDSVENGMTGRVLFAEMPSCRFEHMIVYKQGLSESDLSRRKHQIECAVEILKRCKGFVETPLLTQAIREWCNDLAKEARKYEDIVLDTYRRRAAVIGFRCGVLYQLLETGEREETEHYESKESIDFAILMAEYALENQSYLFGEQLISLLEGQKEKIGAKTEILQLLPEVFNRACLKQLCPEKSDGALRTLFWRWNKGGYIKSLGKGNWQKVLKN